MVLSSDTSRLTVNFSFLTICSSVKWKGTQKSVTNNRSSDSPCKGRVERQEHSPQVLSNNSISCRK